MLAVRCMQKDKNLTTPPSEKIKGKTKSDVEVNTDVVGTALLAESDRQMSLMKNIDSDLRYYEVMNKNRETAVRYLTYGKDYDAVAHVPKGMKDALDQLVASSNSGDLKATREILNRILGGILQNIKIDVTGKKMITDDTDKKEEPLHVDSVVLEPRESRPNLV